MHSSTYTRIQNFDAILGMVFLAMVLYFAFRTELSVVGEVFRIMVALISLGVSLGAAMSMKGRTVFLLNLFLAVMFLALFVASIGVRFFSLGEWYVPELFEVTILDVFLTGALGIFFLANARSTEKYFYQDSMNNFNQEAV